MMHHVLLVFLLLATSNLLKWNDEMRQRMHTLTTFFIVVMFVGIYVSPRAQARRHAKYTRSNSASIELLFGDPTPW